MKLSDSIDSNTSDGFSLSEMRVLALLSTVMQFPYQTALASNLGRKVTFTPYFARIPRNHLVFLGLIPHLREVNW
jgi:hypothetical protein